MSAHPARQFPRRLSHAKVGAAAPGNRSARRFDYSRDYRKLDLRAKPAFYRVGVGEQGVLLVQPYKSEILPHWKFKTPSHARESARAILGLFERYRRRGDFIGMDMARKFLQMGYTRSRRYANHASGRKYDERGRMLPFANDAVKARSARIFKRAWKSAEADPVYLEIKRLWKERLG